MAEEPKPNSIEDIGDARIVIDDDIADGHGRMPQPFARDQFARLSRWARKGKVAKSDVIRALIDRAGPIDTGDDLSQWVDESAGKGLGLAQRKP